MFCPKCGAQADDNMSFCNNCGARLGVQPQYQQPVQQYQQPMQQYQQPAPQYQQPAPQYRQQAAAVQPGVAVKTVRSKKPLIILLIALAVLVAGGAVAMFLILGNSAGSSDYTSVILTKMGVVYNGKLVEDSDGDNTIMASSLSGDTFAIRNSTNKCVNVLKNGKLLKTNVNMDIGIGMGFSLAASGDGIAYYTSDHGVELMDTNTGEITVIEESGNFTGVTISPDGKTVAYSDSKSIHLYTNGESKTLMSADLFLGVVSVANDGKYVFAYNMYNDRTLYCLDSTGEILASFTNCLSPYLTNKDNTQVTFRKKDGESVYVFDAVKDETYTYPYGGMFTDRRAPVGYFTKDTDYQFFNSQSSNGSMLPVMHFDIEDLTHCLSFGGDGLYQLDGNSSKKVNLNGKNIIHIAPLADGSIAYLTHNFSDSINTYSLIVEKDGKKDDIGVVDGFGVSPGGRTVFYFTTDGRLMQYRNGEKRETAENVCTKNYLSGFDQVGVGVPVVLGDDVIVYPGNDGKWHLYNKGKTEQIPGGASMRYETADSIHINNTGLNIRNSMNSLYFFTDTYFVYENDSGLFIIDYNGNTSPIE